VNCDATVATPKYSCYLSSELEDYGYFEVTGLQIDLRLISTTTASCDRKLSAFLYQTQRNAARSYSGNAALG